MTVNEEKLVQLWKLDDLECVKEWPNADFNEVKAMLSEHDMKHS